jgi:hypothetical protein
MLAGRSSDLDSAGWLKDMTVLEAIEQIAGDSGFADRLSGEIVFTARIDGDLDEFVRDLSEVDPELTFEQLAAITDPTNFVVRAGEILHEIGGLRGASLRLPRSSS